MSVEQLLKFLGHLSQDKILKRHSHNKCSLVNSVVCIDSPIASCLLGVYVTKNRPHVHISPAEDLPTFLFIRYFSANCSDFNAAIFWHRKLNVTFVSPHYHDVEIIICVFILLYFMSSCYIFLDRNLTS